MKRVIIHSLLATLLIVGYITGDYLKDKTYINDQGVKVSVFHHKHKQNHKHRNHKDRPRIPAHKITEIVHGFNITKGHDHIAKAFFLCSAPLFIAIIIYLILRFKSHIQWFKFSNSIWKKIFVIIHIAYFIDIILSISSGLVYTYFVLFSHNILESSSTVQALEDVHKITSKLLLHLTIFHVAYALYYALIKKSNFCRKMIFLKPINKD